MFLSLDQEVMQDLKSNSVNWASEASPTLGCSIEISRDIYIYVGMYVCLSYVKSRGIM